MALDHIRHIYRDYAPKYDDTMRLAERLMLKALRSALLRKARGQVLEVAIGTGVNLQYYPPDCQITGMDLVPEMLAHARTRSMPFQQVIGDVNHIPYPDHSFDTVVATLSACTFPDPIAALREIARVCRPEGRVLMLEHVRGNNPLVGRFLDRITPYTIALIGCHPNRDTAANLRIAGLHITALTATCGGLLLQIEAQPMA
jgi:ubiquinone/menaquinone biosynthesis C-methylase UbiE